MIKYLDVKEATSQFDFAAKVFVSLAGFKLDRGVIMGKNNGDSV